jgi:Pup amidohydrolase
VECWQGIEVEYGLPTGADARRVLKVLEGVPRHRGTSVCIPLRSKGGSFLVNGGKVYVDRLSANDILELCTPECRTAREALTYERAIDRIVAGACKRLGDQLGKEMHCYKTSIAYADTEHSRHSTRGLHESYLVESQVLQKTDMLVPFLAVRPLFCGVGGYYQGHYVLSPRQFFIRAVVSADVHKNWPFIARGKKPRTGYGYARLHVCNGEGARCEITSWLRNGVTSLVIRAIEQGLITAVPTLRDPIAIARELAYNVEGDWTVTLHDGRRLPAIEYLEEYYLKPIQDLLQRTPSTEGRDIVRCFEQTLDDLRKLNLERLSRQVDWVVKLNIIDQHMEDYFLDTGSDPMAARETLDFQFKAVTDSTFEELETELEIERLTSEAEVNRAMSCPPPDSRGALRGELALQLGDELEELDWDSAIVRGRRYSFPRLDGWNAGARQREVARISRAARGVEK